MHQIADEFVQDVVRCAKCRDIARSVFKDDVNTHDDYLGNISDRQRLMRGTPRPPKWINATLQSERRKQWPIQQFQQPCQQDRLHSEDHISCKIFAKTTLKFLSTTVHYISGNNMELYRTLIVE
jgi:hypothetical protein